MLPDGYTKISSLPEGFLGPTALISHDSEPNTRLVCKTISFQSFESVDELHEFVAHVKKIAEVKSPFVVPYTTVANDDSNLYLIRPYIEGQPLTYIHKTQESVERNTFFALWKIYVRTISHLHQHNIYPNILKPNNIFVASSESKVFFITDLYPPISSIHKNCTKNPLNFGFFPPEIFTKAYQLGPESDVWSLGVLLVFCLTGNLPWKITSVYSIMNKINRADIEQSIVPDEILKIVKACILVRPSDRCSILDLLQMKPQVGKRIAKQYSVPVKSKSPSPGNSRSVIGVKNLQELTKRTKILSRDSSPVNEMSHARTVPTDTFLG